MEGSNESYALKWSDFGSDFAEGVQCLFREEAMVDVTLAVDGRFLQAHKLVLSVCSSYFKNLFKVNPCKHPIVIIKDVSYNLLSNMLDFIYKGEANIQLDELNMFMNLAENLKIKGLAEKIQRECPEVGLFSESLSQKRKRKIMQSVAESDESENESRLIERRKVKKRFNSSTRRQRKKKSKSENVAIEEKVPGVDNDSDSNPLVTLVSAKHKEERCDDSSADDNNADENSQDFEIPPAMFSSNGLGETSEQGLQGGVDYQMIQTKRGRDMLLYDGYTFTQNRMCKDGMRWQCSQAKCKAFCRMSSAGWLTPHKNVHDHERPSEEEIKRRILRMELKARAQSSGATPGEIIRNALPANEYSTMDQRACYTRCIQRHRKSLLRKAVKQDASWPGTAPQKEDHMTETWLSQVHKEKEEDKLALGGSMWSTHAQPVQLSEEEKRSQLEDQKDNVHTKIGYEI